MGLGLFLAPCSVCDIEVGWEQKNVVVAFAESSNDVALILKKRPHHVSYGGFDKRRPVQPRKELPKLNVGPKLRRSYGRKLRKAGLNSSLDELASQSQLSVDRLSFSCMLYNCFMLTVRERRSIC